MPDAPIASRRAGNANRYFGPALYAVFYVAFLVLFGSWVARFFTGLDFTLTAGPVALLVVTLSLLVILGYTVIRPSLRKLAALAAALVVVLAGMMALNPAQHGFAKLYLASKKEALERIVADLGEVDRLRLVREEAPAKEPADPEWRGAMARMAELDIGAVEAAPGFVAFRVGGSDGVGYGVLLTRVGASSPSLDTEILGGRLRRLHRIDDRWFYFEAG